VSSAAVHANPYFGPAGKVRGARCPNAPLVGQRVQSTIVTPASRRDR
jgi:hypothetical protein